MLDTWNMPKMLQRRLLLLLVLVAGRSSVGIRLQAKLAQDQGKHASPSKRSSSPGDRDGGLDAVEQEPTISINGSGRGNTVGMQAAEAMSVDEAGQVDRRGNLIDRTQLEDMLASTIWTVSNRKARCKGLATVMTTLSDIAECIVEGGWIDDGSRVEFEAAIADIRNWVDCPDRDSCNCEQLTRLLQKSRMKEVSEDTYKVNFNIIDSLSQHDADNSPMSHHCKSLIKERIRVARAAKDRVKRRNDGTEKLFFANAPRATDQHHLTSDVMSNPEEWQRNNQKKGRIERDREEKIRYAMQDMNVNEADAALFLAHTPHAGISELPIAAFQQFYEDDTLFRTDFGSGQVRYSHEHAKDIYRRVENSQMSREFKHCNAPYIAGGSGTLYTVGAHILAVDPVVFERVGSTPLQAMTEFIADLITHGHHSLAEVCIPFQTYMNAMLPLEISIDLQCSVTEEAVCVHQHSEMIQAWERFVGMVFGLGDVEEPGQ